MTLTISDKYLSFLFENPTEEEQIKKLLTGQDMSAVFMNGTYNAKRIRNVCFVKKVKNIYACRSGFLHEVLQYCKDKKLHIEKINDERTKYPHQKKEWSYEELRSFFDPNFKYVEHQINALKMLLKTNVGIIKQSTSAGKTSEFIALMKATQLPTLILVNKVSLAYQTFERIKEEGLDCGICSGNGIKLGYNMVSTIGSVKKIPDLHNYKMLIIDEVHNSSAKQFQDFLNITSYPLRFGFSATPEGNDKYKFFLIRQYLGSIIFETKASELLENGVIVKPKIRFVPTECIETFDWPSANDKCIINNKKRNAKIVELYNKYKQPTLILVKNIEHGENLQKGIPNSIFVSGIKTSEERTEIIKRFENKEIHCVIATEVFNEGISINIIRVLILASLGKSIIKVLQGIGRGLRKDEGKEEVLIFDFIDEGNRFCYKHSKMRMNIYKKIGFEIES